MALLERVATLVRANLNDLVDRAEQPDKMIKQVILDMENQLMQVKTQVAISLADEHLLERKRQESVERAAEYRRKAELAVGKSQDDLARAALERTLDAQRAAEGFAEQTADQHSQVETLKTALRQLEEKLGEARTKSDLLLAQHHRARAFSKAGDAQLAAAGAPGSAFDRMQRKVQYEEATGRAKADLVAEDVEQRLTALGKEDEIEKLLQELKAKKNLS